MPPVELSVRRSGGKFDLPEIQEMDAISVSVLLQDGRLATSEFSDAKSHEGMHVLDRSNEAIVGHGLFLDGYRVLARTYDLTLLIPRTVDLHTLALEMMLRREFDIDARGPELELDALVAGNVPPDRRDREAGICLELLRQVISNRRFRIGKTVAEFADVELASCIGLMPQISAKSWAQFVLANHPMFSSVPTNDVDRESALMEEIYGSYQRDRNGDVPALITGVEIPG